MNRALLSAAARDQPPFVSSGITVRETCFNTLRLSQNFSFGESDLGFMGKIFFLSGGKFTAKKPTNTGFDGEDASVEKTGTDMRPVFKHRNCPRFGKFV
jgi:hypothetical protein